ncbi:hypothetical protein ACC724_38065, partial [Rhizobium ruizarguesonis]
MATQFRVFLVARERMSGYPSLLSRASDQPPAMCATHSLQKEKPMLKFLLALSMGVFLRIAASGR